MAYKLKVPFYAVELKFLETGSMFVPISEHNVVRLNSSAQKLAKNFEKSFQTKVLDKGNYVWTLDFPKTDFKKGVAVLSFPAARNGIAHPAFTLNFDYYYSSHERGFWAIIPALGLESFGVNEPTLVLNVQETIKLEFARKRRLQNLREVISTIWYEATELFPKEVTLQYHTPNELEKLGEKKKEELLPQVAKRLVMGRQVNFGREKELEQLVNALKGKFGRNVLLVGPSGVGKTNLVWEMVFRSNKLGIRQNVYETSASTMIKELTRDTGWQDNLSYLCRELAKKGDILFIRNFLELFEVGQYEGNSVSMADYMRSYISRGEISLISECTDEEFAKIEMRSPNYLSMFQVIRMEEPRDDLEQIITQKVEQMARNRRLKIEREAIEETIRLNKRYTPYSGFPGKPIRFLESILLNNKKAGEEILHFNKSLIYKEFCEEAGMPTYMVDPEIPMDLTSIKSHFQKNIFGQTKAVDSVVDLLASVKTALTREGKPIASFLFVGPTGVGKTEMAKVLADFMFGSRERMIRFDMSEYSNPYTVMRLTGESYFKDGLLTSAVRQTPFSVILFDEIEKAHPVFYDLLLQMLGEGRLTDSAGRLVNFCSTIIIMTSNIGAANLQTGRVGWNNNVNLEEITTHFDSEVRKHFRPELFNRIDQVIPFEPLTADVVRKVTHREIALLKKREGIAYRNMDFYIADEVYEFLGRKGYDPKYGARQLQRVIREEMVIPLAAQLNRFAYDEQLVVNVKLENDKITFDIETDPLKFDLLLEELTRNEFADHSGALRRSIKQLQEGSFYVQLTSELSMLETRLHRNKDKFWESKKESDKYTYYLATKDRVEKMSKVIEAYEEELALVCMDLKPYNTHILDKIKTWEQRYFDLKVELFTRIHPQSDNCRMGIYGRNLEKVIKLYFKIFETQNYVPAASTLWFREEYYNEEIEVEEREYDDYSGIETITKVKKPRREYISKNFDIYDIASSFKPPKSGDIMVGMEVDIFGRCPHLYFSDEEGFHRWKASGNKYDVFQIRCFKSIKDTVTPIEIHRKRYFERQKSRRTYTEDHIKDNIYKINREANRDNLAELLGNAMSQRFSVKLDSELI